MVKGSRRPAAAGVVPLIVILSLSGLVSAELLVSSRHGSDAQASDEYSYSDNGLTCTIPSNYRFSTTADLVKQITQDPEFLKAAGTSAFVFGNAENITGISVGTGAELLGGATQNGSVVAGNAAHLPDVLELVFYSYGPGTTCADTSLTRDTTASPNAIVVQIPIESAGFNMTGATFSLTAASW
jgi:hypothetical protein